VTRLFVMVGSLSATQAGDTVIAPEAPPAAALPSECGGRFGCVDHPPIWYDQFITEADNPGEGWDTECLARLKAAHIKHTLC
jgi:hypothetical protein